MIKERQCPSCRADCQLIEIVEWGKSKKYDKLWKCRFCHIKITEKGVDE